MMLCEINDLDLIKVRREGGGVACVGVGEEEEVKPSPVMCVAVVRPTALHQRLHIPGLGFAAAQQLVQLGDRKGHSQHTHTRTLGRQQGCAILTRVLTSSG